MTGSIQPVVDCPFIGRVGERALDDPVGVARRLALSVVLREYMVWPLIVRWLLWMVVDRAGGTFQATIAAGGLSL